MNTIYLELNFISQVIKLFIQWIDSLQQRDHLNLYNLSKAIQTIFICSSVNCKATRSLVQSAKKNIPFNAQQK